ncbi:MAG: D-alanyl-D-alanine carboxypeptidase [Clostridia bacterium]|nr:D-alanyl-D-alanine carboxypeptidase [Clostridia bacterium]
MVKKRIAAFLLALFLLVGVLVVGARSVSAAGYSLPEGTALHASAAILVSLGGSAANDVVLYEKGADEVHAPGSMMRYMVLAYALQQVEKNNLDIDTITGTYTKDLFNRYVAGTGVPTANMAYEETWTLRDLMSVAFMQSASDVVAVLATAIDGSVATYIEGMNALATELGCTFSHFANLTGIDSLSQYTTARDMYRIVRYCQQFSVFENLAVKYQVEVNPVSGGQKRTIVSGNSLLQPSSTHRYTPIVHSRTGLSEHEGRTCASVARDSGYEYLVVVMGCPEQNQAGETGLHYRDTKALFKWAFSQFEYKTVLAKSEILASLPVTLAWDTDHINLVPAKEIATVVDAKLDLSQVIRKITLDAERVEAPIEKGTVLGRVELIVNVDQKIGEVELVASDTISRSWLLYAWSGVANFFTSLWFWLGLGVLLLLIIGYGILNIVHNHRRRRQRLQRVKRQ